MEAVAWVINRRWTAVEATAGIISPPNDNELQGLCGINRLGLFFFFFFFLSFCKRLPQMELHCGPGVQFHRSANERLFFTLDPDLSRETGRCRGPVGGPGRLVLVGGGWEEGGLRCSIKHTDDEQCGTLQLNIHVAVQLMHRFHIWDTLQLFRIKKKKKKR